MNTINSSSAHSSNCSDFINDWNGNYYAHPYVSNSGLSKLKQDLSTRDAFDSKNAFRIGTLQDCFITEMKRVDFLNRRIDDYDYTQLEFDWARRCKELFYNHPICQLLSKNAEFQKEFYVRGVQFVWNGVTFMLDCRCKYDGWLGLAGWGWDLKSTQAGYSYHDCLGSIETFDYDRSAYFYMHLTGSSQMPFIFITKDWYKPKLHIVYVKRGDAIWKSGREKCNELAFKHWMLCE